MDIETLKGLRPTEPAMARARQGACLPVGKVVGGLAQLARAPALQAGGQRFESVILHGKGERRGVRGRRVRQTSLT